MIANECERTNKFTIIPKQIEIEWKLIVVEELVKRRRREEKVVRRGEEGNVYFVT